MYMYLFGCCYFVQFRHITITLSLLNFVLQQTRLLKRQQDAEFEQSLGVDHEKRFGHCENSLGGGGGQMEVLRGDIFCV